MSPSDQLHSIAFSLTKGASATLLERMEETNISLNQFFSLPSHELVRLLGCNEKFVPRLDARLEGMDKAHNELKFVTNNNITVLQLGKHYYPKRLAECIDAPPVIYMLGKVDLNYPCIMAVVGTRRCTSVGVEFIDKAIGELVANGIRPLIVSGLAYGIDTAAHEAALKYQLPTIAVVAHGLDTIYPSANRHLARNIIKSGGAVISEYPSKTQPFRPRFLERNRIVAGLSDITLVVESEIKGGAMSTARLAFEYDREVAALPGRFSDIMSAGCNHLININRATLVSSANDIMTLMNWKPTTSPGNRHNIEPSLFQQLEGDYKVICDLLQNSATPLELSEIQYSLGLPVGQLITLLGEMEFDGLIVKLPGNKFRLSAL